MATLEKVRRNAIRHTTSRKLRNPSWNDLRLALNEATPAQKNQITTAVFSGSAGVLQRIMRRLLKGRLEAEAVVEVDAALADGSLTLEELDILV